MSEQIALWVQDGIDSGWFTVEHIGSVRSSTSYRAGGWWFLPVWLPDTGENDIGPFKTKAVAFAGTERLTAVQQKEPEKR